jgi:hypothetical protein
MANYKSLGVRAPGQIYKMATLPVAAGAVFYQGDFVRYVTSGTIGLTPMVAASTVWSAASSLSTCVAGRAQEGSYSTQWPNQSVIKTSASIIVADVGVEFVCPLWNSNTNLGVAPNANMIGTIYGMYINASSVTCIDAYSSNTNTFALLTDFDQTDYPGWPGTVAAGSTLGAWAYFVFIAPNCLLSGARSSIP